MDEEDGSLLLAWWVGDLVVDADLLWCRFRKKRLEDVGFDGRG